ncbi:unnamed protein product [Clavelina lepadiformis]|uniref:EGF-like domain-containing protein n=1 Tax=Clavelina lepadiformis TaxID=159417 RepID=A0ABP0GKC5_CLALP
MFLCLLKPELQIQHGISQTTTATSFQNRCDLTIHDTLRTDCINCRANLRVQCPLGYRKTTRGQGRKGCRYNINYLGRTRPAKGCLHTCLMTRNEPKCCDGFWGQDCQAVIIHLIVHLMKQADVCEGLFRHVVSDMELPIE